MVFMVCCGVMLLMFSFTMCPPTEAAPILFLPCLQQAESNFWHWHHCADAELVMVMLLHRGKAEKALRFGAGEERWFFCTREEPWFFCTGEVESLRGNDHIGQQHEYRGLHGHG